MQAITASQYYLVYNSLSFTIATFAAATLFFWFGRSQCSANYRTAVTITGLVTFIALYHYWRMFESWDAAFNVVNGTIEATGIAYNRAYRYVDWLLTVPLLLIELILVMRLSQAETMSRSIKLGGAAALMIVLGYPGEVSEGMESTRPHLGRGVDDPLPLHRDDVVLGAFQIHRPTAGERAWTCQHGTLAGCRVVVLLSDCLLPAVRHSDGRWRGLRLDRSRLHDCGHHRESRVRPVDLHDRRA